MALQPKALALPLKPLPWLCHPSLCLALPGLGKLALQPVALLTSLHVTLN